MAYGRSNPKRLTDYFGGLGNRRKEVDVMSPGQPTRSEIEAVSRQKYRNIIKKDIADSERRRAALEGMWQAEKDAELAERKQAVEEYNAYAKGAPDADLDTSGELRAAFWNTTLGKAVSDRMTVNIQASVDKTKRNDPNSAENRGVSRQEYEKAATVGEKFTGGGRRIQDSKEAPGPKAKATKPKEDKRKVILPGGRPGTIVKKEGNVFTIMDRATRKTSKWTMDKDGVLRNRRGEVVESRPQEGLDPLMGI
jgi:hypothetical protein